MSKKSFTDANPAMAFISTAKDKEDFALTQPIEEELEAKESNGVPMKKNPEFIETKSKRVQMLMQPSLHIALKQVAAKQGISVNEAMHEILKQYVDDLNKLWKRKNACICVYVYVHLLIIDVFMCKHIN